MKQFEVKTAQEFEKKMIKLSKNNDGVFTASVVFGGQTSPPTRVNST